MSVALIVVDWENLWRSLIRNLPETKKSPVGLTTVFDRLGNIIEAFKNQGKKVFAFIFLPPYYSKICAIAPAGLLWSYCPTFGIGKQRYNTADQNIMRLVRLVTEGKNHRLNIQNIFGMGPLSYIETRSAEIFKSGKVSIFWPDGDSVGERHYLKKITRIALHNFLEKRDQVSDVCLLSGDCDFQSMIERLQRKGVNVIVSSAPNDSLSPVLQASANEFWDFSLKTPH